MSEAFGNINKTFSQDLDTSNLELNSKEATRMSQKDPDMTASAISTQTRGSGGINKIDKSAAIRRSAAAGTNT